MKRKPFDIEDQKNDLPNKLIVGLERISEAYRVLLWEHAKQIGLSPIQIQILIFLKYHKEELRTVSYLALEFNMTKPTVSDAVKILFQKDLIEKRAGLTDARSYTIALSQSGSSLVAEVEGFANPIATGLTQLSREEQDSMFEGITKLIHQLNKGGIITVQRTCFGCIFYEQKNGLHHCHYIKKPLQKSEIRLDCEDFITVPTP